VKVKLTNVRLRFPKLDEPKPVGTGEQLYYSGAFPVEPKSANHIAISNAMKHEATSKWATKADAVLKKLIEDNNVCFKLKPLTDGEGNVYGGFEGMYSLNASVNEKRGEPALFDNDLSPLNDAAARVLNANPQRVAKNGGKKFVAKGNRGRLYDGCYVDVTVDIWPQDNENGKRINAQLVGVQFRADGDSFSGGAVASVDDFDDLSVTDGGSESSDDLLGVG